MVDINLNHSSQTFTVDNIHDEARKIYQQYQLIPISDKSLFLNNFIHAFAGTGYESIFYSYILADIVGAQLHKKFADSGDLENTELMQKYHNQFLSKGATINANQALTSFLGEGINSKAFLEFYGLG
jgi:Zn-dependent oligopeptidase